MPARPLPAAAAPIRRPSRRAPPHSSTASSGHKYSEISRLFSWGIRGCGCLFCYHRQKAPTFGTSILLAGISREVSTMLQTRSMDSVSADESARTGTSVAGDVTHLRQLTRQQWRSGIAAWLGWTFDGLDMHIYTLVAAPFVAQLLGAASTTDPRVGRYGSIIQGGFMLGWALGGGFFGRIGDRLGRARALSLTVLTYAAFTGLSFFAHAWWHLLIFRFLAHRHG